MSSQEKPKAPETVKYGDVFQVSGELASKPVAPLDAATAQSAESIALGHTLKGGPAAVMQSAADVNLRRRVVDRDDVTEATRQQGVSVTKSDVAGERLVTEAVGGQVVGRYVVPAAEEKPPSPQLSSVNPTVVTIGQALESAALSAGDKPVDESDAAAIQVAELKATGRDQIIPGGVASKAQSAAKHNERTLARDKKIKLQDVLAGATKKLPDDGAVTKEDAERIVAAEIRNKPDMTTFPGGVGESVTAAAKLNLRHK